MIEWNVSPEIIELGPLSLRWYGILFASSFLVGYKIIYDMFKNEGRPEKDLNDLVWYMAFGTVIGARLGHCLFYNPEFYLSNPLEIIKIWSGGLASHGAAIGILISLHLFVKKKKSYNYFWLLDRVVITVALAAFFIRMGNLFNSEIIGIPTDLPWAFVFISVDNIPRHPAQLYEALAYLCIFFGIFFYYKRKSKELNNGFIFGLFLTGIFGFRFFIEFIKKNQTSFEDGMALNMGQILSLPLIVYGLYLIITKRNQSKITASN